MNEAYEIAKEMATFKSNSKRGRFVKSLLEKKAKEFGRTLKKEKLDVSKNKGNFNYILSTGRGNPFMLCAHYDSFYSSLAEMSVPGANDNGSGVGVAIEALSELAHLNVDLALFGAEEGGRRGSKQFVRYVNGGTPTAVLNLDCCGFGDRYIIPSGADGIILADKLKDHYVKAAKKLNKKIITDYNFFNSDHTSFLEMGIPATSLFVYDRDFYGETEHSTMTSKGAIHTLRDDVEFLDEKVISDSVKIAVNGTKSLFGVSF